ncbi:MAG TPA: SHD1 domain-containing protein [Lacipirellulaceae bacterium]|nr:SHD1 domain-containing protein [Lacipirellulaceae bacterium]
MGSRPFTWRVTAASTVVATICLCGSSDAQREKSKYNQGDRVEVRVGFDWKPATVESIDRLSGWIEARPDLPPGAAQFRGPASLQTFPPSSVRPIQNAAAASPDTPLRKWSDKTGRFSIEARYLSTTGNKVALLKADGKRIEVPIDKLSDEDARYLKTLSESGANPFQEVGGGSTGASATLAKGRAKKANWNGAKLVQPKTFQQWSFTPPAPKVHTNAASHIANANVTLAPIPDSNLFFEEVTGIYASSDGQRVFVCRNKGEVSNQKEGYLEVVNVGPRQASDLIQLPDTTRILDVNPDASLVILRPDVFGSGENSMLTVARVADDKVTPLQQWEPYADEDFATSRDIAQAWFLNDNRVMTINSHGKALTIWDVAACKALINIPVGISFDLHLALSPDRQLLAIIMKEGIAIIDLAAGRHVATIPTNGRQYNKVAIRNDNMRLAGLSNEGATVWNLADGKVMSEFYTNTIGWNSRLQWAGEYLLADSNYLFDVERRILLWEYQNPPGTEVTTQLQNGRLYAVSKPMGDKGRVILISAAMPSAAAIEKAKTLPPAESLLVVKPGDSVELDVDIDPRVSIPDELQQSLTASVHNIGGDNGKIVVLNSKGTQNDVIRRSLTNALHEAGLTVVEHSDLVVKAVCKPQPQQTIRIRVDNRFPPRPQDIVERSITPHATYLEMSLKGQILWRRGFVAEPRVMIWLQKGETLDQALERLTKPNVGLLTHAKFCPYVARPGKATPNGAYGVSQFTAHGLVDGRSSSRAGGAAFE